MNYINLKDFINGKAITEDQKLFIGKTRKTYLIGPIITKKFDKNSFFKRINSSSVCDKKTYKKITKNKAKKLINKYYNLISDNEMLEVFKDGKIIHHKIIKVTGVNNE